jgi:hypothetical protein
VSPKATPGVLVGTAKDALIIAKSKTIGQTTMIIFSFFIVSPPFSSRIQLNNTQNELRSFRNNLLLEKNNGLVG